MAKQTEFTKYLPLEERFRRQPATAKQIALTFDRGNLKNWKAKFEKNISHPT